MPVLILNGHHKNIVVKQALLIGTCMYVHTYIVSLTIAILVYAYCGGYNTYNCLSTALEQSTAIHRVVSVHTSNGAWGTGVLVKYDIIITCAHVIQQEAGILTCITTR